MLLQMRGIDKSYPGVHVLRNVDLDLQRGEVLALLGENGAGKSTLIKILAGAVKPDAGTIHIDNRTAVISDPLHAQRAGIAVIYQEFNLIPALSARENIFLGREKATAGWIHRRKEHQNAQRLFDRLGVDIDPHTPCRNLSIAGQQIVEIAKALSTCAQIIVMDEPTAALTSQEVERLFAVVRELKSQGIGVIYISHRLEEIFEIADRVMVLRDGERVGVRPVAEATREKLIEMMVGRTLDQEFPPRNVARGKPRLVVQNLSRQDAVRNVSFTVHQGEVLAITGLVGAGRTETARLLFGADRRDGGTILLDGRPLHPRSPRDAIRSGLCLLTEDRKAQGLVLGHSVRENFGLPNLSRFSRTGVLRHGAELRELQQYISDLRIKVPYGRFPAKNLSGGNQQKVVLAKWLARHCQVIIFDEPTRGIDVGAKYEIYQLINRLAAAGKAIIMISSELPEVLGMADRILVMHGGKITGEIQEVAGCTQEQIMELAVG